MVMAGMGWMRLGLAEAFDRSLRRLTAAGPGLGHPTPNRPGFQQYVLREGVGIAEGQCSTHPHDPEVHPCLAAPSAGLLKVWKWVRSHRVSLLAAGVKVRTGSSGTQVSALYTAIPPLGCVIMAAAGTALASNEAGRISSTCTGCTFGRSVFTVWSCLPGTHLLPRCLTYNCPAEAFF
jgi:hypothetical protein